MKKLLLALVITISLLAPHFTEAATRVSGYYRSNGTYVRSYYRSDSDGSKYNNYSSYGNYNPYTGKKGYKKW